MIDPVTNYPTDDTVSSVYETESKTIIQMTGLLRAKVNECINVANSVDTKMNTFNADIVSARALITEGNEVIANAGDALTMVNTAVSEGIADLTASVDAVITEAETATANANNSAEQASLAVLEYKAPTIIDNLLSQMKKGLVAHRGLMNVYPENTLPGFVNSCRLGYDAIELDIHESYDGELIVMHDDDVTRTTNGAGLISNKTLTQIKALTVDTGTNIALYPGLTVPTLDEVLNAIKQYPVTPLIEIKGISQTGYTKLLSTIRQYGFEDNCIIVSFNRNDLDNMRTLSRKLILLLNEDFSTDAVDWLKAKGNGIISVVPAQVTANLVQYAHQNGVAVAVYTVDSYEDLQSMRTLGVDIITTNVLY